MWQHVAKEEVTEVTKEVYIPVEQQQRGSLLHTDSESEQTCACMLVCVCISDAIRQCTCMCCCHPLYYVLAHFHARGLCR